MRYLLFRLYGPLSSWGDVAVGETRPSFTYPSKSAVLGLIAAALGIRRDEEVKHQQLAESLSFAVCVESIGLPLADYHTAQVPSGKERYCTRRQELSGEKSELNTILSTRDYRSDGLYIIVLWQRKHGEWSIEQIKAKLEQPEFIPYLGRKSCPAALPFEAQVVDAVSLVEALAKGKFISVHLFGFKPIGQKMLYWDDCDTPGLEVQHTFERRDLPLSRCRWQFDTRKERHAALI